MDIVLISILNTLVVWAKRLDYKPDILCQYSMRWRDRKFSSTGTNCAPELHLFQIGGDNHRIVIHCGSCLYEDSL